MTVHYCDRCGRAQDEKTLIKVTAERKLYFNMPVSAVVNRDWEVCEPCFYEMFKTKKDYEFPPQTVEAISGVSPV